MQKELEIMHEIDTLETISIPDMPAQGGILMTFFLQHGLECNFPSGFLESSLPVHFVRSLVSFQSITLRL